MAEGFASDISGDDTVMKAPQATVSINISQLPPQQALAIAQQAGLEQQPDCAIGKMVRGETSEDAYSAQFHLPFGPALTLLSEAGVIDLPQDPNELDGEEDADAVEGV